MHKKVNRSIGVFWALILAVSTAAASELQDYVLQCQSELGFYAHEVPQLDCNDGERFALRDRSRINDFVVYHRVNAQVDLVAACRWGNDRESDDGFDNTTFISLELIIHNRQNGATCFFAAKDVLTGSNPVPNPIVSPTNFSGVYPDADDYWLQPTELNNRQLPSNDPEIGGIPTRTDFVRCVDCHSQGPYIASKDIAPYLAQFGLLNDGHDITVDFNAPVHYHAVGSSPWYAPTSGTHAFKAWNSIIYNNLYYDDENDVYVESGSYCSSSCHQVAVFSDIGSIFPDPEVDEINRNTRILPSISEDIDLLAWKVDGMPPYEEDSNWRWMNLDTPWNDGIESETFVQAKDENNGQATEEILYDCDAPGNLEAHAVGIKEAYSFSSLEMGWLPDRLSTFNLKEGLVCLNAHQGPGQTCRNYQTSYLCDGEWTGWFDTDSPNSGGDHEERSRVTLCANPTAIKARFFTAGIPVEVNGPTDRLARFSAYGLTCNNDDQVDGKCSNYVVRYRSCTGTSEEYPTHIVSAWSNKQLTASGNGNNAPAKGQPYTSLWNTQEWMVETEFDSDYVRLRNTGTGTYLNVSSQNEDAVVETYEIRDWDSQRWIVEPVPGSADVRLKNVWSGKYLTIRDTSNYSGIYSQSLNTGWASQRWRFQP